MSKPLLTANARPVAATVPKAATNRIAAGKKTATAARPGRPAKATKAVNRVPEMQLDYVAYRLDTVSTMLKRMATADYKREFGVTVRDLRILRFVAQEPGLIQGRLAALCLLEKGATSKLVSAMVRKGFLERQIGTIDARHIELRLTPEGERVVERCDEIGHAIERDLLNALTPNERAVFEVSVAKLIDALRAHKARPAADDEDDEEQA